MLSKPLGVAALAVAMVAAAGVGSYLALRANPTQAAPAASVAPATTPATTPAPSAGSAPAASPSGRPVAETEAVVTPTTPAPAPVEAAQGGSGGNGGRGGREAEGVRPSSPGTNGTAGSSSTAAPRRPSRPAPATPPVVAERRPTVPATRPAPATTTARREPAPATRPGGTVSGEPSTPVQNRPVLESEQARATPPPPVEPIEPAVPAPPPEPPKPTFAEYVLDSGSVMGLQIENSVSSATAKIEDRVDARVTRDVRVAGDVAVPAGSRLRGEVTLVEEGGKFKEQARLGIRFHTLVLADGTSVPIATETIYRLGEQMGQRSAAKIGGAAVGGAIIGAILGGGKGAAIGGAAGAGAGTAATMAGNRSTAVMQAGSTYTVRLTQPATVRVEKEN